MVVSVARDGGQAARRALERCIGDGGVAAFPADTLYGLAADPFNLRAVDRVYEIKSRSRHKPLSLLIESVEQAKERCRDTRPLGWANDFLQDLRYAVGFAIDR